MTATSGSRCSPIQVIDIRSSFPGQGHSFMGYRLSALDFQPMNLCPLVNAHMLCILKNLKRFYGAQYETYLQLTMHNLLSPRMVVRCSSDRCHALDTRGADPRIKR